MKKLLVCILSLSLFLSALLPLHVFAEAPADPVGQLSGETESEITYVTAPDGSDTGVQIKRIELSGTYGDKEVWIATGDLSNPNLSIEVINCGEYMVSSASMMNASETYNQQNPGQTVLAAINGDLWMTNVHSNEQVTTKVLKVPRGFTMIDGEIWATQQIGMENYVATNGEKGTTSPDKASFGVTSTNQPLVGVPVVDIQVKNVTKSITVAADGINRLPAYNSLIVYNYRCNDTNYALSDAYEVEIEVDSSAFTVDGTVSGTVKAIYPANSSTRPTFNEKNVVLTARGSSINNLKNFFTVGDKVSFSLSLTDKLGNTELWQDVEDAIGGHMIVLNDGKIFSPNGNNSEYTTTLIGYKNDGKVMMLTINSQQPGKYAGLNFTKGVQFCQELGYNSVFYLDGGGSATFVSMEEGDSGATYVARNNGSDPKKDDQGNIVGSYVRSVINGVGFVWNDQPVCQAQGSLDHIEYPLFNYKDISTEYVCGELMNEFMGGHNATDTYYDAEQGGMVIKLNTSSNDPFAAFDMTSLSQLNADQYKYIVICAKTPKNGSFTSAIYYACGNVTGAVAGQMVSYSIKGGDEWNYYILDMSRKTGWSGKINNLRFDIFDGPMCRKDDSVVFSMIGFAKTKADAEKLTNGQIPEGCIRDFGAFKQKLVTVHNVKKNLTQLSATAAGLAEQSLTALDQAKELENANDKTPALFAQAQTILDSIKANETTIHTVKDSAQVLTNEVEDAQALQTQAQDAFAALEADAAALMQKIEELNQVAQETEPPTTKEPTTEAPTTEMPTTEQPTTEQPTTQASTTAQPQTEPETQAETQPETVTEQPTTQPKKSKGCNSVANAGIVVMALIGLTAFWCRKREENA